MAAADNGTRIMLASDLTAGMTLSRRRVVESVTPSDTPGMCRVTYADGRSDDFTSSARVLVRLPPVDWPAVAAAWRALAMDLAEGASHYTLHLGTAAKARVDKLNETWPA